MSMLLMTSVTPAARPMKGGGDRQDACGKRRKLTLPDTYVARRYASVLRSIERRGGHAAPTWRSAKLSSRLSMRSVMWRRRDGGFTNTASACAHKPCRDSGDDKPLFGIVNGVGVGGCLLPE